MSKYGVGLLVTAISAAVLVTTHTSYVAFGATFVMVFGIANTIVGVLETIFKYLDSRR